MLYMNSALSVYMVVNYLYRQRIQTSAICLNMFNRYENIDKIVIKLDKLVVILLRKILPRTFSIMFLKMAQSKLEMENNTAHNKLLW